MSKRRFVVRISNDGSLPIWDIVSAYRDIYSNHLFMSKKESTKIDSIASSVLFSHCPVIIEDPEIQENKLRPRLTTYIDGYICIP